MSTSYDDANDILFGSGVPSAKLKNIGDSVFGTIVKLEGRQQTEFRKDGKPGELLTWPDGRPKMQVIVTLQTAERDPSIPDDDGKRRLFIKGKNLTDGVKAAVKEAGAKRLDEGGQLAVVYTADEPSDWGGTPAHLHSVAYQKPSGAASAAEILGMQQPAAQPVAAQPAVQAAAPVQTQMTVPEGTTPEATAMLAKLLAAQGTPAVSE